jgi:hypothetical protein
MNSKFEIIEITSSQHPLLEEFVSFRAAVRKPPYNVGGPGAEQVRGLISWGLAHESRFWIVRAGNSTVARLCARISPHLKNHGSIGLFEIDLSFTDYQEVFDRMIQTALAWLSQREVKDVAGPIDLSTWFTYRFSLPGKKFFPRFSWEPTTPPEYLNLFRRAGFQDLAYYHSVYFPHFRIGNFCLGTGPMKKSYKHLLARGFSLRPFDAEKFVSHELPIFHEISHEAFHGSFLFEPIDLSTFSHLYAGALRSYDFSPSSVLISPEGEIGGFIFAFYDGPNLVIKSIAIKKKFQGKNLSSGMIYHAVRQAFALNKKGTISALVKLGLASESIEKNVKKSLWFTWSHEYILLKKEI